MKNISKYLIIIFVVVVSLSSCKKDDNNNNNGGDNNYNNNNNNNNNNNQKVLKFLNIVNAKSLLIMNSTASKNLKGLNEGAGNMLFKITPDGYIVEVPCIDQNGDTVNKEFVPMAICNLTDNYLTVTFQNQGTYLVRKSDGAVFKGSKLPVKAPDVKWAMRPDLFIQQDKYGNIYYVCNSSYSVNEVIKLDVSDPSNITTTTYSVVGDEVNYFAVDKEGNMAYSHRYGSARYRNVGGAINNFNGDGFWTDIDNSNIYCLGNNNMRPCKITPSPFKLENYGDSTRQLVPSTFVVKVKNKNKVIGAGNGAEFRELYNSEGKIKVGSYDYFKVTDIKMLASSDDYYYVVGVNSALQSVLLKVDPTDHTYTSLITTGDYEIYNIVVSKTDEVQFYALRMSDGKRVLAKIDNAGKITVLSVLDTNTVTSLERIN